MSGLRRGGPEFQYHGFYVNSKIYCLPFLLRGITCENLCKEEILVKTAFL